MKQIGINLDDETIRQIRELALLWGLPDIRHNTDVVRRCVERVWMAEIGSEMDYKQDIQKKDLDNMS